MSYSISTLLTRNLPWKRSGAETRSDWRTLHRRCGFLRSQQGCLPWPRRDRIAGVIKATHPDFSYQLIAEPEEVGDGGRVPWVSGRPGDAPAFAGTYFIIARDGRIAAIYLFSTSSPEMGSVVCDSHSSW